MLSINDPVALYMKYELSCKYYDEIISHMDGYWAMVGDPSRRLSLVILGRTSTLFISLWLHRSMGFVVNWIDRLCGGRRRRG